MAHVEGRARAERAHVVRRDVGVGMHHADVLGAADRAPRPRSAPSRCRSPAPCRRCSSTASTLPSALTLTIATDVVGEIDGLDADGDAAAAPHRRRCRDRTAPPVHPLGERVEHLLDRGVAHDRAGRVRPAVAQDVLAAELDRIDAERARDRCRCGSRRPRPAAGCRSRAARRPAAGWCRPRRNRS